MLEDANNHTREIVAASTHGVPTRDKFAFWHDVVSRAVVGLEVEPLRGLAFDASVKGIVVNDFSIVRIAGSPHSVTRRPETRAGSGSESLVLNFVVSGRGMADQDGRTTLLLPGDGAILDADRPYILHFDDSFEIVTLKLPRNALSRRANIKGVTALSFSQTGHLAPLIYGYLEGLSRQASSMDTATFIAISRNFAYLLSTALDEFHQNTTLHPRSYRNDVLVRLKRYLEDHLYDDGLRSSTVAKDLKLSPRYINKLLKAEDTSLVRYIWSRRLDRIADDLANLALAYESITTIALRHGFNDLSHFSRAFRHRFGVTPKNFRAAQSISAGGMTMTKPSPRTRRCAESGVVTLKVPSYNPIMPAALLTGAG